MGCAPMEEGTSVEVRAEGFLPTAVQDAGRGIVRIDAATMRALRVAPGAAVAVTGRRTTAAVAEGAYPRDAGLGIARMDALTCENAGALLGGTVKVAAALSRDAAGLFLVPAREGAVVAVPE